MFEKKSIRKHSAVPPKAATAEKMPPTAPTATPPTPVTAAEPKAAAVDLTPLIEALRHSDADVAREAATTLGTTGNSAAVPALIDVIVNGDGYYHSVARAAAAASLGQLRDPRAFAPLIAALRDPMAEASAEAVRALATLGDARAVEPLIEVIRNETGFYLGIVRRAAVVALAQLGGERAKAELLTVASNAQEDPAIRQAAAIPATR